MIFGSTAREGGAYYREFPSVNCIFNPLVTPVSYFLIILPPIFSFEAVKLRCWVFFFLVQLGLSALLFSHADFINKPLVIFFKSAKVKKSNIKIGNGNIGGKKQCRCGKWRVSFS